MHARTGMSFLFLPFLLLLGMNTARGQDQPPSGLPPLMKAAWSGNVTQAKQLLQAGVPADEPDKQGRTALMWTAIWTTYDVILGGYEEDHREVARVLLAAGASLNAQDQEGKTALIHAVAWDHPLLAKAFLDGGADVNLRDHWGRSALTFAAWYGAKDEFLVKPLLARGMRMNGVEALLLEDLPKAYSLLRLPSDLRARGPHGETALMLAALQGDAKLVHQLLSVGADVNSQDERGFTALMLSVGAIPSISQAGIRQWLAHGPASGREAVVEALLAKRAILEDRDKVIGSTALMWAVERQQEGIVAKLIRRGAKVNVKNEYGESALEMARTQKNQGIIILLKQAGAQE